MLLNLYESCISFHCICLTTFASVLFRIIRFVIITSFNEPVEGFWSPWLSTLLFSDFLAGEEALEYGKASEVEDGNEKTGDEPCNEQDDEGGNEWLHNLSALRSDKHVLLCEHHSEVHTGAHDDTFADSSHDPSDYVHSRVRAWISDDHEEGLLGSGAEVAPVDGHLDVRILTDELDALVEAPDHAANVAHKCFENWVIWSSFLIFLGKVLEKYFDHGHDGNEERSKSK